MKDPVSNDVSTTETLHQGGRKRHMRKWFDRKLRQWTGRGLVGGLGSSLLALPALAQATIEELYAFQFVETIPGVRSAKLLQNGDVLLKMVDGRSLVVPAENVQVLEGGAIMIAEGVVAEIAQFSVAAEAGGAAAGGLGGAGAVLGGIGLAGAAAAGAGGGGDDAPEDSGSNVVLPPPAPALPSLNLAELQGTGLSSDSTDLIAPDGTASVEVMIGSEPLTATPASDGSWSVSLSPSEIAGLPQGASEITITHLDADGNPLSTDSVTFVIDTVPPTLAITGFSDGAVMNAQEQGTDLVVTGTTDAENGQTVTLEINGQSYTAPVANGAWSVSIPAADLSALSDDATVVVTADVADAAGNPAAQASSSFDTDFTAPLVTLNPVAGGSIELVDASSDLTLTGTTTAEDGQTVTVAFDGQIYSGTASAGGWSVTIPVADLAGLATGIPASVSVTVNDAAGNPATPVAVSVPVDLTGPSIAISPLVVGTSLNLAESGSDLVFGGSTANVPDGQTVTVSLDGQTYSGTVSGGSWSVTVPSGDLGALADGGSFTVTADVSDADGLPAPQASTGLTTDFSAPSLSIDSYSDGAVMNSLEQGSDLIISGSTSAEDGQTITVSLNGDSYTGTASGGAWSVTVPAADLSALADGSTIAVTADVSDAAGNPAPQASGSFDTDFTAPTLTISTLSDGAVMNAAEQGTNLTVSGTSDAANGTVVSVEIVRGDGTVDISGTATVTNGAWTFTATPSQLSGLQDATSYDVNAAVSDAAGNAASATTSFDTDFSAPTISVDPLSVGSVLDVVERDVDLSISGTTTAEDGQTITLSLGGETYTATASGGVWGLTVPASDLNALGDGGTFTVTASTTDAAGNPVSDVTTSFTTDFRPLLEINSVGSNNSVSLADAQSTGVAVSGTSAGLSNGQVVNVTLNSVSVGTATVGADGTWSLTVPASDFSGIEAGDDLNFAASATVSGGPDPLPGSDQAVAHVPAVYVITEAGSSGSTVTFEIHVDSDVDVSSGFAITADLGFDPTVAVFDSGSATENDDFDLFLVNPNGSAAVSIAGAATSYSDVSAPVMTFTMTVVDPTKPIELTITTPDGGPVSFQLGTENADTLTASGIDDIIRGGDGNDTIDLTGAGRDIVIFETDVTSNGTDTITGFTIGPASNVTDALMFSGLDVATLRGNGTDVEILTTGSVIGAETGFVGLTSTLSDLGAATITAAVESLSGTQAGDEIYVLATDGADSVLVKVDYSAPGTASVETLAHFDGLADLSGLSNDNILLSDPTGATA